MGEVMGEVKGVSNLDYYYVNDALYSRRRLTSYSWCSYFGKWISGEGNGNKRKITPLVQFMNNSDLFIDLRHGYDRIR